MEKSDGDRVLFSARRFCCLKKCAIFFRTQKGVKQMRIAEHVEQVVTSTKVAATVAAGTTATGASQWFGWIDMTDLTKLATLAGAALSVVLTITHLHKAHMDHARTKLELEITRQKERDRQERTRERMQRGEPVRRKDDF